MPGVTFSVLLARVACPPAAAQGNARGAWRATNNDCFIQAFVLGGRGMSSDQDPVFPPAQGQLAQYSVHDEQATGLHDLAIVEPDASAASPDRRGDWRRDIDPPIDLLSPNAMWIVPITFSSSRITPVSVARSFVPMPNSATLRASRPCGSSSATSFSASGRR